MGFFSDVFSNPGGGALGGAAIGTLVGGPMGTVPGALVGGGIGAGNQSNKAQSDAAAAQLAQREKERQEAMGYAQKGLDASMPTGAELMQQQFMLDTQARTLAYQQADMQRQEKLISAIDPALIEAGSQALQLLQGKSAQVLDPMLKQRASDRAKLESNLQSQLGGGYATSTAGIQALNQFDQQTNLLTSQAQAQYTGSLLGISAQVRPDMGGIINRNAATLNGLSGSIANFQDNLQKRQATGWANMGNASSMNSLVPYAGAPYMGDYLNGQMWGGIFNSAQNTLVQGGSAALTGGAFSSKGSVTGNQANTYGPTKNYAGPDTVNPRIASAA